MDGNSCGFYRARSRPAMNIKGMEKAVYFPKIRYSPKSFSRRLASPLFLLAASSYHEALKVAQLDKADATCAETDAARPDEGFCHAAPHFSLLRLLPPPHPSLSVQGLCQNLPVDKAVGRDERQEKKRNKNRISPSQTKSNGFYRHFKRGGFRALFQVSKEKMEFI
jgi:hypothetical protein